MSEQKIVIPQFRIGDALAEEMRRVGINVKHVQVHGTVTLGKRRAPVELPDFPPNRRIREGD